MGYRILTKRLKDGTPEECLTKFSFCERTANVVEPLERLRVRTSYYSDLERYRIAQSNLFKDFILEEKEDGDDLRFRIQDPDLSKWDFLTEVAKLIFPGADVSSNKAYLDYAVVMEALDHFLSPMEPNTSELTRLFSRLSSSQKPTTRTTPSASPNQISSEST